MARIPAVGGVVVHPDGRVLLIRRAHAPSKGEWTLPGGKVETGEAFEAAIVREIAEETGLTVEIVCRLTIYVLERDDHAYDIHEFLCVPADPDAPLVAGHDASEAMWVSSNDLESMRVRPEASAIIRDGLSRLARRPS